MVSAKYVSNNIRLLFPNFVLQKCIEYRLNIVINFFIITRSKYDYISLLCALLAILCFHS